MSGRYPGATKMSPTQLRDADDGTDTNANSTPTVDISTHTGGQSTTMALMTTPSRASPHARDQCHRGRHVPGGDVSGSRPRPTPTNSQRGSELLAGLAIPPHTQLSLPAATFSWQGHTQQIAQPSLGVGGGGVEPGSRTRADVHLGVAANHEPPAWPIPTARAGYTPPSPSRRARVSLCVSASPACSLLDVGCGYFRA